MHDFNLTDAFKMIDNQGKNWTSANDLRNSVEEFGCFPHKNDV